MGYPSAPQLTATWIRHIEEVPEAAWDELAQPLATPFFLNGAGSTIWNALAALWPTLAGLPSHLTIWRGKDLVGAAPLYLKGHSYGEFVFDHQWADLRNGWGCATTPKLLGMSPFTPAEGYRFLIAPGEDEMAVTLAMVQRH